MSGITININVNAPYVSLQKYAEITGIPLKTLNAFSSSPDRSILKTNALNVYKLAQLFGVSMEQLLLTECEINPTSKAFLESKEV